MPTFFNYLKWTVLRRQRLSLSAERWNLLLTRTGNCTKPECWRMSSLNNGRVNDPACHEAAPMTRPLFEERLQDMSAHTPAASAEGLWTSEEMTLPLEEIRALAEDALRLCGRTCINNSADIILISGRNESVLAERSTYPAVQIILEWTPWNDMKQAMF